MKYYIVVLGLILSCITQLFGKSDKISDYKELVAKAETLYNSKQYLESARAYSAAFESAGWKALINDRYNSARSWAMADVQDSAFSNLQKLVDKVYFDDYEKIVKDEGFKSIHHDSRWKPLIKKVYKNKETSLPDGWLRAGTMPTNYLMKIEKGSGKDGDDAFTLKSEDKSIDGFGTIMKNFMLEKYLGKRIRMTGYLKTKNVENWAGFWFRIDGNNAQPELGFDNMKNGHEDRSIHGTTDWQQYEIVLDVSEKATNLACGALLAGTGQIWFEKIKFEIVDETVPTTGRDR